MFVSFVRSDRLDFVKFKRDVLSIKLEKKGLKLSKYILQVLIVDPDHHEPSLLILITLPLNVILYQHSLDIIPLECDMIIT